MLLRELSRLGPTNRPRGELLLLLIQKKKPTFGPDSEAFNSYIGDCFLVPELKDTSEASKDEQADSSSEKCAVCYRAAWIWRCNCPFPARLGGGKGNPELPSSIRYAMSKVA